MKFQTPPFFPEETIAGRVVSLSDRFAVLDIRGWHLPLETRFIDWNYLKNPSEILSIGCLLDVVVHDGKMIPAIYRRQFMSPKFVWHGYWLDRLPLLENFWPELEERYTEGSVVEVEFIDYTNWYIGRVRMPGGYIVEMRTNDIHPRMKSQRLSFKFQPGESFKVIIRQLSRRSMWVQRFVGSTTAFHFAEAGYVTPKIAEKKLTTYEQEWLAKHA